MSLLEQQEYQEEVLALLQPAIQEWDINVTDALVARDDHLVENQGSLYGCDAYDGHFVRY